jgi:hypothetical protein
MYTGLVGETEKEEEKGQNPISKYTHEIEDYLTKN